MAGTTAGTKGDNQGNGQWRVKAYPDGAVQESHFEFHREAIPEPGPGEFLVQTTHLIITPPLRMAIGTGGIAGKPLPIGSMMRGSGQGKIVRSNHPDYAEGDIVSGPFGWQEYCVSDGVQVPVERVKAFGDIPITANMHAMGSGGTTAYIGLYDLARPVVGDVVLVSAAAGNVGSIVCQLAKLSGCRVIGIAGNDRKCAWLVDELGMDGAINYKTESVADRLDELCPKGIDIYFDNVGGEILDLTLARIRQGARIVLCGATSQYEGDANWRGPDNYFNLVYKQASMVGFYIFNFRHRFPEAYKRLQQLIENGDLCYGEDVLDGVEQLPNALIRVLAGENFGTQLVRVGQG